ncbi:hypothetical protein CEXT_739631 [Caerostris extrusa]|uniref:Uncharacterized protein n=1 Tax=Caerostris extrusa TaxID=172846 RepID=A0AAV4VUT9_CAEEX|nr:hypothetical protein CEXT_739631 [Caerostris extrusa]
MALKRNELLDFSSGQQITHLWARWNSTDIGHGPLSTVLKGHRGADGVGEGNEKKKKDNKVRDDLRVYPLAITTVFLSVEAISLTSLIANLDSKGTIVHRQRLNYSYYCELCVLEMRV